MAKGKEIDGLNDAQRIIMRARLEVISLAPIHDKLCRISAYINARAEEILLSASM